MQEEEERAKAEKLKALTEKTDFEKEEEAEQQRAIDITEKKMLAQQYQQQMIEDDEREGKDGGKSNFQVIADQKAEQDYAVNVFKGSGNMSEFFDKQEKEAEQARKAKQLAEV